MRLNNENSFFIFIVDSVRKKVFGFIFKLFRNLFKMYVTTTFLFSVTINLDCYQVTTTTKINTKYQG